MKERLTTYHCGKAVIKDKNKLSEAMEKLAEFEEKEKCGEWLDAIELAKIAIALQSQKWIPCSERLPKERDSIFARWKGTDKWNKGMFEKISATMIAIVEYSNGEMASAPACTRDGKWRCDCIIGDNGKVIAWMPLPKPYKE